MRPEPARLSAAVAFAFGLALPLTAQAKPQWNVGWETGLCITGKPLGDELGWCNAAHGDVLFLRERSSDFGLGPSLRLGTVSFDDFRLDAGLSVLLPLIDAFPIVLEAGPALRNLKQPGVFGSVFFGLRSLNHYGHYEMASGLVVSAERALQNDVPSAIWITARIDGAWLALPFVLLANGLR